MIELGVEEMDRTHHEFVALVDALQAADNTSFAALFQQLLAHTRLHFENEGRLMRIARFPALGEHEAEHHRVYADLVQMNRAVQRGRPRPKFRRGFAEGRARRDGVHAGLSITTASCPCQKARSAYARAGRPRA